MKPGKGGPFEVGEYLKLTHNKSVNGRVRGCYGPAEVIKATKDTARLKCKCGWEAMINQTDGYERVNKGGSALESRSAVYDYEALLDRKRASGFEAMPTPIARKFETVSRGESQMNAMRRLAGITPRHTDRAAPGLDEAEWKPGTSYQHGMELPPNWRLAFGKHPYEVDADGAPVPTTKADAARINPKPAPLAGDEKTAQKQKLKATLAKAQGEASSLHADMEKSFKRLEKAKASYHLDSDVRYKRASDAYARIVKLGDKIAAFGDEVLTTRKGIESATKDKSDGYDTLASLTDNWRKMRSAGVKDKESVDSLIKSADNLVFFAADTAYMLRSLAGLKESRAAELRRLLGERTKFLHGGESEAEGEMAKLQLRRIVSMAQMLDGLLVDDDQLPGWVQSHISDAANNLTQVLGYMEPKSKE